MIYEVRTTDFTNKCGNCRFFETPNGIDGNCVSYTTKIKPYNRFRSYNSRACKSKEVRHEES